VLVPIGRITIPREVIIFFRRKEYLLRTFYYIKHFQKKEGLGSQYSYIRWDQIATGLNCSEQTVRNHFKILLEMGFILPTKRKNIVYVIGNKRSVQVIRKLQDTTSFSLGCSKEKEKYLRQINSSYTKTYKLLSSLWKLPIKDFRTYIQGTLYIHNIVQQSYVTNKKSSSKPLGLKNDKPERRVKGKLTCETTGEMLHRSKSSGCRIRKNLEGLGCIALKENKTYLGCFPSKGIAGLRQAYPDKVLISYPSRYPGNRNVYQIECSTSILVLYSFSKLSRIRI